MTYIKENKSDFTMGNLLPVCKIFIESPECIINKFSENTSKQNCILLKKRRLTTITFKAEINFALRKKTLTNEKKGIIVFCEIFSS